MGLPGLSALADKGDTSVVNHAFSWLGGRISGTVPMSGIGAWLTSAALLDPFAHDLDGVLAI
jgi:hypothetical protein